MCNAKNQNVIVLHTINNNVLTHRKTTRANAKVDFASTAQIGMAGKKKKPVSDGIN